MALKKVDSDFLEWDLIKPLPEGIGALWDHLEDGDMRHPLRDQVRYVLLRAMGPLRVMRYSE